MQPTDARRAFPCFDEPNMKANFTMKLGRQTTQLSTSNMPVKETTAMSVSYIFLAYVFLSKYRIHMSVNQTLQSWKAGLRLGSLRDVTTCVNLSGWNDGFRDDVHRFASRFKRDAFPDLGEAGSHQSSWVRKMIYLLTVFKDGMCPPTNQWRAFYLFCFVLALLTVQIRESNRTASIDLFRKLFPNSVSSAQTGYACPKGFVFWWHGKLGHDHVQVITIISPWTARFIQKRTTCSSPLRIDRLKT